MLTGKDILEEQAWKDATLAVREDLLAQFVATPAQDMPRLQEIRLRLDALASIKMALERELFQWGSINLKGKAK